METAELMLRADALERGVNTTAALYSTPTGEGIYEQDDIRIHCLRFAHHGNAYNLVAVMGTDSVQDWLKYNLRVAQVNTPMGAVHSGFFASAQRACKLFLNWQKVHDPFVGRPTFFFGHSLGGATAQLMASAYARAGADVAGVYTFGQPRVGSPKWAKNYEKLLGAVTTRFVFRYDMVTAIPWLLGTYRHAGPEAILSGDKDTLMKRPWWWTLRAIASVIPKAVGLMKLDHNMGEYRQIIAGSAAGISLHAAELGAETQ